MGSPKKEKSLNADKEKKSKLVRDSYTIPKEEYAALDAMKARALAAGVAIKKSELLRAGLLALAKMGNADFKLALAAVPTLKTGRPTQKSESPATAPAVSTPTPLPPRRPAGKKTAVQAKAVAQAPKASSPSVSGAKTVTATKKVASAAVTKTSTKAPVKAPTKKTAA